MESPGPSCESALRVPVSGDVGRGMQCNLQCALDDKGKCKTLSLLGTEVAISLGKHYVES